jgi:predicted ATP-dependent protease
MWGRRPAAREQATAKETAVVGRPRALTALEDLLRRADWDQLTEAQRGVLLGAHTPLALPAGSPAGHATDAAIQDWVARLIASQFQPEAVSAVRSWLEDAAPDAHLFVGGRVGHGRTSLVASLARQAMAQRPAPPDYCYVPHPTTLDRAFLLSLPRGTGATFAKTLSEALGQVCRKWEEAAGAQDSADDKQNASPEALQGTPRTSPQDAAQEHPQKQLLARCLDPVQATAPDAVRGYLQQLRSALEALVGSTRTPPLCADDVPVGHVRTGSDDGDDASDDDAASGGGGGAPVVVASLAQTDLQGALLRANGGVLILPAADFVEREQLAGAWTALTAALRTRTLTLKPEWPPIPLTVRVALIGTETTYQILFWASDEFARLFRYEVRCNIIADWKPEAEATYAALADGVARRYDLPRFDPSGVARLVEEGARRAGGLNRTHLTVDLLLLHDLAVEAGQTARARAAATTGADVETATLRRRTYQGANARRVREDILSGQEIVPTAGAAVGTINGLTVYPFHPSEGTFAVPFRISATVSPGRGERLVDVEREARTVDSSHIRGTLTMAGYLARRYGASRPISLLVRTRYEQEHAKIAGDSASAAELFAVLSALSQVPIRCSLAVTGAVGQYGEIQPIGDVNDKIEGFWAICRARRAQGEQPEGAYGVLIPATNAADVMLPEDVAAAIAEEGWFHIWPISTVEEGLLLLTGVSADEIHRRVDQRLQGFYEVTVDRRTLR